MYRETILSAYKGFCLRDVYKFHCEKIGVKVNSAVRSALPTRVGDFGDLVELDFSALHLGEAGAYPVIEVARAAWKLEVLRLRGAGVSNDTVALICQVIIDHPRIRAVDLSDNPFISTPGVEAFIKLARRRNLLCSVLLGGTSAPVELTRKLDKMLADNRTEMCTSEANNWFGGAVSGLAATLPHAMAFEAAIDGLTRAERHMLYMPVLTHRLHREFSEETKHFVSLQRDGFMLPELLRWELDRADECFGMYDGGSGLLSHKGGCDAVRALTQLPITVRDADFEFLFNRVDRNDDGFIERDEWRLLVRNVLADHAAEVKSTRQRQLAAAYRTAAAGEGVMSVAGLAAAAAQAAAIVGAEPPREVEEKAREILLRCHSTTSAVEEDALPMPQDHFVEVMMAAECLLDPGMRHAAVARKILVPRQ